MTKIRGFAVLVCVLSAANAWGATFMDDFNRSNGLVGNGWAIQTNGTIKVEIVDNEVLIAGTQATDWVRCGISRPVSGETRVAFDFKADASFNMHARIDSPGSSAYVEVYGWPGGPMTHASSLDGSWPGWVEIAGSNMTAGAYNTLMLEVVEGGVAVTLNNKLVGTVPNANMTGIESVLLSSDSAANTTGNLHIDNVVIGTIIAGTAKDPIPAHNATDVPRETALAWTAAENAVTHDVYLGTVFADVNSAGRSNPAGVLASQGQAETTFTPASLLEFGQTYFWRVDEVNGAPDNTIITGDMWAFTVEPYAYPLTGVKVTASSSAMNMGPEKTIDGSGFNAAAGTHSSADTQMWLSAPGQALPAWIQYEFSQAYKLQEMTVWNSNQKVESFVGFGAKSVTIEYSLDGTTWSTLGDVEFARGNGSDALSGQIVDMAGAQAKFVRLVIQSNWGGLVPQVGLSEVRFMYIPVLARTLAPASGAEGLPLDATLTWRPGREATSHKVYFSSDRQAVADGTAPAETVTETSYQPSGLEYGKTYYWQVDEVGDTGTQEGNIWSFSTTEFFTVDDMESYNDDDNRIFDAWIDGWVNNTGSQVGYDIAPFAERINVNGGSQSMPLKYDNTASPFLSEAEHSFDSAQNWTAGGADTLSVYFQGAMPGFVETASGGILMNAVGADIWGSADQFRYAYKTLTGNGTMVARVDSIFNSNAWAKGGVMIRQSIEAGSTHAFMAKTPSGGNGASFQHRLTANGASTNNDATAAAPTPYWVKIERAGNNFTGSISRDGTTWTQLGTPQTIAMTGPVLVGLAVTSHDAAVATGAEFSNIAFTGNVAGAWQVAEIGVAQPAGNSMEGLYVTIKDSSGKSKTVTNPDPTATVKTGWQEWRIPLSEFTSAGVKANAVKSMTIGVGNKAAPATGGTGILYIDDVRVGRKGSSDPGAGVAYFPLEDNVADGSGNARDGTSFGNPVFVDGPAGFGKGIQFNGAGGQYVNIGTWNPSAATGQLSVSLWAKWGGLTAFYQGLIGKRDTWAADQTMWQIEASQSTGALSFARHNITGATAPVLTVGEWTHITLAFNGTTAQFYINGNKAGTSNAGGFSFGPDTEAGMAFGACEGAGGNPFNGSLDEVHIYDRALSSFEISFLGGK